MVPSRALRSMHFIKERAHAQASKQKRTQRVAGLQHEALDDSVEDDAVVVAVLSMCREVLHRLHHKTPPSASHALPAAACTDAHMYSVANGTAHVRMHCHCTWSDC